MALLVERWRAHQLSQVSAEYTMSLAGYAAFASLVYEADLWNLGTVYPDLEALMKQDKTATPNAIYGAVQFIEQQVQAQVPPSLRPELIS